jgi:hypothetical protein
MTLGNVQSGQNELLTVKVSAPIHRPGQNVELFVIHQSESQGSAIFSGRREGFALYFARLIRPIWKSKLTVQRCVYRYFGLRVTEILSPSGSQELALPDDTLVTIQKNLFSLKDFMAKNPHLFHSAPGESASTRAPVTDQEAWKVILYFGMKRVILNSCRRSKIRFLNCYPC